MPLQRKRRRWGTVLLERHGRRFYISWTDALTGRRRERYGFSSAEEATRALDGMMPERFKAPAMTLQERWRFWHRHRLKPETMKNCILCGVAFVTRKTNKRACSFRCTRLGEYARRHYGRDAYTWVLLNELTNELKEKAK